MDNVLRKMMEEKLDKVFDEMLNDPSVLEELNKNYGASQWIALKALGMIEGAIEDGPNRLDPENLKESIVAISLYAAQMSRMYMEATGIDADKDMARTIVKFYEKNSLHIAELYVQSRAKVILTQK